MPEQDALAWYHLEPAASKTVCVKGSLVWGRSEQWKRDVLAIQRTEEALADAVQAIRASRVLASKNSF